MSWKTALSTLAMLAGFLVEGVLAIDHIIDHIEEAWEKHDQVKEVHDIHVVEAERRAMYMPFEEVK